MAAQAFNRVKPPVITEDPNNEEVEEGKKVTLSVKVQGKALNYQWMKDGNTVAEDIHHQGVATPYLTITNVLREHAGEYRCEVCNEAGSTSSKHSQLIVSRLTALSHSLVVLYMLVLTHN